MRRAIIENMKHLYGLKLYNVEYWYYVKPYKRIIMKLLCLIFFVRKSDYIKE